MRDPDVREMFNCWFSDLRVRHALMQLGCRCNLAGLGKRCYNYQLQQREWDFRRAEGQAIRCARVFESSSSAVHFDWPGIPTCFSLLHAVSVKTIYSIYGYFRANYIIDGPHISAVIDVLDRISRYLAISYLQEALC